MDVEFGMDRNWKPVDLSALALRLALAASFLSAVADRFGIWGKPGEPHVSWGDFAHFVIYTERLTSIVPQPLGPSMAWIATVAEIVLALALLVGWQTAHSGVSERFAAAAFCASDGALARHQSTARLLCIFRSDRCFSSVSAGSLPI